MSKTNVAALPVDNNQARRLTNKAVADTLAGVGAYVFQTAMKTPITPRYNQADDALTQAEVEEAVEEFKEKHKYKPVQVGATRSRDKIKAMYKRNIDAMWSIACGPSKIVVIDADSKDGGPEKIGAYFEEHGLPEGCVVVPTQNGGRHYYFSDPDGKFTNSAGLLKSKYGCDVRGRGGQCVAPGSIREDGKTYGTGAHLRALRDAIRDGTLPPLPDHVVALIGAKSTEHKDDTSPSKERETIKLLQDADWDKHENDFDPDLGSYDLDKLRAENSEFKELYDNPGSDCSTNRFLAARHVMREWPDMPAPALSMFFAGWDGAGTYTDEKPKSGEYDDRQIAREWLKNQGLSKPSNGDAFGAVVDEDDDGQGVPESVRMRPERERLNDSEADDKDSVAADKAGPPKYISLTDLIAEPATFTRWVVKHFIAYNTTYIAAGLWGSGKTAVLLDLALHVAHGLPWRGRKVHKGVVVYCALENPGDVKSRVRAWCKRNGEGLHLEDSFVMYQANATLFDPKNNGTPDERKIIKLANETAEKLGLPVAMVIIDTVAQAIMPGNDREHGGLFVAAMQRIAAATGSNVTGLHHPSKDGDAVRGDGRFQGNTDAILLVERNLKTGLGTIKASEQKFRIGDPHKAVFNYRLEPVKMDVDEDHEDINVVVATEAQDETWVVEDPETDARLSEAVRMAEFDEYPDYLADFMRRRIAGAGDGLNAMTFLSDDLRADTAGALDHFANRKPASDKARLLNQRRAQLSRALSTLEKRGVVRVELIAGRHTVVHMLI